MVEFELKMKKEFAQLQAECDCLRTMVDERDVFITSVKSEIYRKDYKSDTEKMELRGLIMQKEASIKKLEVCILIHTCISIHTSTNTHTHTHTQCLVYSVIQVCRYFWLKGIVIQVLQGALN